MANDDSQMAFQQIGLGSLLKQYRLRLPPNQREYSWTDKEITTLFQDFSKAMADGASGYFLGTVVTIPKSPNELEVVDGQQRLATTAILLATIRNYLIGRDAIIAEDITNSMLTDIDRTLRERTPKLRMNVIDNDYFRDAITKGGPGEALKPSHKLIKEAFKESAAHVKRVVAVVDEKDHGDTLNHWLNFIEHKAQVVLLKVPSDANAYKMFETLNARGLPTSQADLVKNYLFAQSGDRLSEAQQKWALMRGTLDSMEEEEITVAFLRAMLIITHKYLRQPDVFEELQAHTKGPQAAVAFLSRAESLATTYVAMGNPDHEKWSAYPSAMRRAIETLNLLNIRSMRFLMLAVSERFNMKEATAAFTKFVSWEARFLIAGNTRTGGTIELPIAKAARKVYHGEVTTAKALAAEMVAAIPSDEQFRQQFEQATASKHDLARYYLRSLELATQHDPAPWFIPNASQEIITLEHVLPTHPEGNWPQFDEQTGPLYVRRIGNMVLLRNLDNSNLRSAGFEDKKPTYAKSPYELTRHVSDVAEWTPAAIDARQKVLAAYALKAWPI